MASALKIELENTCRSDYLLSGPWLRVFDLGTDIWFTLSKISEQKHAFIGVINTDINNCSYGYMLFETGITKISCFFFGLFMCGGDFAAFAAVTLQPMH